MFIEEDFLFFPIDQFSSRYRAKIFTLQINSWSYNHIPSSCSFFEEVFILYDIRILSGKAEWSLRKRYSEFDGLHGKLFKKYPSIRKSLPQLPPKSCYPILYDIKFLNCRKQLLQSYMENLLRVLSSEKLLKDPDIEAFLQLEKVQQQQPNST